MKKARTGLKGSLKALWLAGFVVVSVYHGTGTYVTDQLFWFFFATGSFLVLAWDRAHLVAVLTQSATLWKSVYLLALLISISEILARYFNHPEVPFFIPWHTPYFFCLPILAVLFLDQKLLDFAVASFCLLVLWHFLALPLEGITGLRLSWHPNYFYPRQQGILNFQASGLAIANPYFAGFHLPLFYIAFGLIRSKRALKQLALSPGVFPALAVSWVVVCLAVQSRSVFIGNVLAAMIFVFGASRKARKIAAYCVPALLLVAVAIYFAFLTEGKSGADLRWVYVQLYFAESLKWPYWLIGHGQPFNNNHLYVPGYQFLVHSHNDLAQVAFWWGWVTLGAYLAVWFALLRVIYWNFVEKKQEYWPIAAIVSFLPHMVSDLGIHHYEKTMTIGLLIALTASLSAQAACAPRSRRG